MRRLNPHNWLSAIDPPTLGLVDAPPRRWQCRYCGVVGLLDELRQVECAHVYPPCPHCGQTPECAIDCKGIAEALGAPGVHVTVGKRPANA